MGELIFADKRHVFDVNIMYIHVVIITHEISFYSCSI